MASYTIDGRTYNSFQNFKEGGYRKTRGHLLAITKKRDKFLDDPDESVRSAAELIKRHDQGDISNEDIMYETMVKWSFRTCILIPYIHIHIRNTDCKYILDAISAVVDANIDPNDAERWGDEPKTKPYSEYTDDEKLSCITYLLDQGFERQLLQDENFAVRYNVRIKLGFTEADFDDVYFAIRRAAYERLGYTPKAFQDEAPGIRMSAYIFLGFPKNALDDQDEIIRQKAATYYNTVGKRADE